MKKRVLIFSLTYYPRFVGGAEVAIKEITDRIHPKEIEFHMVTLRFDSTLPKVERVGNVLVHRIGFTRKSPEISDLGRFPLHLNKFIFQFYAVLKAFSLHRRYRYDGIWAMMAHAVGVPAGLFKTFHPDVFYVLTLQEGDPPEYIERKARPVWPLFVRGFRLADFLVGESTFLEEWGKRLGFRGTSTVIPNGVDIKRFTRGISQEELGVLKGNFNGKEGEVYLITTSRLVKKNAVDDVIKSLVHLPDNIHFLILGIGPDEKKLKDLANSEGVAKRTHFLGFIESSEIPRYLHISHIFIRPSLSEGMGNSFIEAMAAGLPVIATQVGGIVDFLFDPERNPNHKPTGLSVGTRNPKEIARQTKRLIGDETLRDTLIQNAFAFVKDTYDWNYIAKRMKGEVFSKIRQT